MNIKQQLKHLLGRFYCFIYGVQYHDDLYIGLGSKLVGGGKLRLSKGVKIMPQAMLVSLQDGVIEVGENTEISMYSRVASMGLVKIERDVITGPHVFIADYNHEYHDTTKPIMYQGNQFSPMPSGVPNILIGEGSWIGTNVVIVGNVHIGKHCVIGANSVVTKNIPDYCVAAGIPAKVIRRYNGDSKQWERV